MRWLKTFSNRWPNVSNGVHGNLRMEHVHTEYIHSVSVNISEMDMYLEKNTFEERREEINDDDHLYL